jgi:LysM repeat protein
MLRELNLGLREPFWKGRRHAPAGYTLRLPRRETADDAAAQLARATPDPEPVVARKKTGARKTSVASAKAKSATKTAASKAQKASVARTHRVKPGETVSALARRYGVTERSILAANGMRNGKSLRAGQTLRIPAKRASGSAESDEA